MVEARDAMVEAIRHGALPHALGGEGACPEGPGLAHGLARVCPRQQMGMVDPMLRDEVGS